MKSDAYCAGKEKCLKQEIDIQEITPDAVLFPGYIGTCDHKNKWNTCPVCNDDYCKECWERHAEGEFICEEM